MRIRLMMGHFSIQVLFLVFVFGVIFSLFSPTWYVWLVVPIGVGMQFTNEYLIHRFMFHQPAPKSQWLFDLLYQLHYGHHDFPNKTGLFFVPVWFAVPALALNLLLVWGFYLLVGLEHAHYFAIATTCVGGVGLFLVYEWFHMTAHVQVSKTAIERYASRLHGRHHFSDYGSLFHVTPGGIVVDLAMGTDYDAEKVREAGRVEFIKTLSLKPDDERLMRARRRFAGKYGISEEEIAEAARI